LLYPRYCEEQSDEAIQSRRRGPIASRSLSSGAHLRDPVARNDEDKVLNKKITAGIAADGRSKKFTLTSDT
jgi:hypothetical protein